MQLELVDDGEEVVENIRLFQTEQRVDSELEGLQEITQAIGAISHADQFYSDITARIARLMDIALKLEGLYRHASTHAAGVVIGDRPRDDLVPLNPHPPA